MNYSRDKIEPTSFADDVEKMRDFVLLSKEEFLRSYSYLTEEEYDLTAADILQRAASLKTPPPARNLSLAQVLGILDEEIHASEILSSTDKSQKQREARATKIKTLRFVSDLLQARAETYAAKGTHVVEADKPIPALSADLLSQEAGTVRLWARVGMTLDVSPETYARLKGGDKNVLTAVLQGKEGRAFLNGETYFPDIEENRGLEEMDFDLFAAIHPQRELGKHPSRSPLDAQIKDAQSRTIQDKSNDEKEPER